MSRIFDPVPVLSVVTVKAERIKNEPRRKWQARIMDLYRRKKEDNKYTWVKRENIEDLNEFASFTISSQFFKSVEERASSLGLEVQLYLDHGDTISLDPLEDLYHQLKHKFDAKE